jgi:hypothetical protein
MQSGRIIRCSLRKRKIAGREARAFHPKEAKKHCAIARFIHLTRAPTKEELMTALFTNAREFALLAHSAAGACAA